MLPKGTPFVTHSTRQIRDIEEKARQRKAMREFLIKERSDPFRSAAANGEGFIEDPAIVRYEAQFNSRAVAMFGRVTAKQTMSFLNVIVLPTAILGLICYHFRSTFEEKCSRGEIAYRDRNNKFV